MTDWALETANKLAKGLAQTGNLTEMFFDVDEIAQALRKAKADGIMETCLFANDLRFYDNGEFLYSEFWAACTDRASEIEKGTP